MSLKSRITLQYVHHMHIGVATSGLRLWLIRIRTIEKRELFLVGEMSRRDEFKEIGNLRKPSSGMASGKVFPENNPAVNNSGNDRIS